MNTPADRLGQALQDRYRIERELGAGGMATVYLAHDVRHDRKVALKVLRPELSAILGAERFLAEIKTTANLQHPHILGLFDSGEADGNVFYVMPYVDGESLRDRLERDRQLPVDEALQFAREVADALEYAHQRGIVHRDIKPENILLHGGHAVVADFGIALAASRSDGGSRMTETGMSLGTPHYMSPEQAMGEREITPKADIYALGCVLYEMLTAEPPFVGASAQAIIGRVLTEEPRSLTAQRKTIPPHVEAAVHTALAKLPADRFASAKEFAEALGKSDFSRPTTATRAQPATVAGARSAPAWARSPARVLPWIAALTAFALYAREMARPAPAPAPVGRFALDLSPPPTTGRPFQALALSPDGSRLVYVATPAGGQQLFTRLLDQLEAVPIPGTANATSPFFSADGQSIAFVSGTRLMKVLVGGGPVLTVTDVQAPFHGGTWSEQDTILFADDRGLHLVSAAGGPSTLLAAPDSGSGSSFRWPEFLPGGRAAILSTFDGSAGDHLTAITLDSRQVRRYDVIAANPHFVERGYVSFAIPGSDLIPNAVGEGTLMAVPFDPRRLEVTGDPFPVVNSIQVGPTSRTGKFGMSRRGDVAFASAAAATLSLVEVSREGTLRDLGAPSRAYTHPRLSPDGRRIAVVVAEDGGSDNWVFDRVAKTLTRVTFDGSGTAPVWTPDGRRLVYTRAVDGKDLAWILADGSAPAETLSVGDDFRYAGDVTPDGRTVIVRDGGRTRDRRILSISLDGRGTETAVIEGASQNHSPSLSPDGRWLAYVSDEGGGVEVYVRPFPGPGGKWQVSRGGGDEPRWSPTGREIFFRAGQSMMAASVGTGATFSPGEVRELFTNSAMRGSLTRNYDTSRDGQAFIMVTPPESEAGVLMLLNWFDNLPPRLR